MEVIGVVANTAPPSGKGVRYGAFGGGGVTALVVEVLLGVGWFVVDRGTVFLIIQQLTLSQKVCDKCKKKFHKQNFIIGLAQKVCSELNTRSGRSSDEEDIAVSLALGNLNVSGFLI